ncbi:hypothetical protein J4405_02840 [Candidatus Woesearchaeota archaeon]|nr:hypothetical protein [Candidatus Woesearchaeota archaeon]
MRIKQYTLQIGYTTGGSAYCLIPETEEEKEILDKMKQDCSRTAYGTFRLEYSKTIKQRDGSTGLELKVHRGEERDSSSPSLRLGR